MHHSQSNVDFSDPLDDTAPHNKKPLNICPCCQKQLTSRQIRRHKETLRLEEQARNEQRGDTSSEGEQELDDESNMDNRSEYDQAVDMDFEDADDGPDGYTMDLDDADDEGEDEDILEDWQDATSDILSEGDKEEPATNNTDEREGLGGAWDDEEPVWDDNDPEDMVDEDYEAELQHIYEEGLEDDELDNVIAFTLRQETSLTRSVYNKFRFAYSRKLRLRSEYKIYKLMDNISSLEPVKYDCCVNSCCIFVGKYEELLKCPFCKEPRHKPESKVPQKIFHYIPLIPRLKAWFRNPNMVGRLSYRATYDQEVHDPTLIQDIFDCNHYRSLREKHVEVNGKKLSHKFFSDLRDIALGLSGDGIQVFKNVRRGSASVTPLILINYNLPPTERNRLQNIISLGIIPGPKGPKDTDSFLWPLKQELDELAAGVPAYDCTTEGPFTLHAYLMHNLGDIPWMTKVEGVKGHNGFSPCRACEIEGVRNLDKQHGNPYYVPLRHPDDHQDRTQRGQSWDPNNLPLRSHESFGEHIQHIRSQPTKEKREQAARDSGINGESILYSVSSIDFSRSFPYEFMHLLFENIIPNLIKLWKGTFKEIEGGDWVMPAKVWEVIGEETANSIRNIPSAFVGNVPNIATDQNLYKAEYYSFWFTFLAPILLRDRLHIRYYTHACKLVEIIKCCLEFAMPRSSVGKLRADIIQWVLDFERLYYQYKQAHLPMCTLTLHGLLHVVDGIEDTGPVWTTWSFVMERYAGSLLPAVKSRLRPNSALSLRVKRVSQLHHVRVLYQLEDLLNFKGREQDEIVTTKEAEFPGYKKTVLRFPRVRQYKPPESVFAKIISYFGTYAEAHSRSNTKPSAQLIRKALPRLMSKWGKVRIKDGGDLIRGSDASTKDKKERNSSFVRYTQLVDKHARDHQRKPELVPEVHYGELHHIIVCPMSPSKTLHIKRDRTFLFAYITPCNTMSRSHWPDATEKVVTYDETFPPVIVDIQAVECVVGRVEFGTLHKKWAIIDRSGEAARTVFADEGQAGENEGEDEDEDQYDDT